jgi:hypothetical protein
MKSRVSAFACWAWAVRRARHLQLKAAARHSTGYHGEYDAVAAAPPDERQPQMRWAHPMHKVRTPVVNGIFHKDHAAAERMGGPPISSSNPGFTLHLVTRRLVLDLTG